MFFILFFCSYRTNINTKPILENVDIFLNTKLIESIAVVESKLDSTAYSSKENAVGILQIRPIMVKDVNRILSIVGDSKRYTLEDRWSISKSIEMFSIYSCYYSLDLNNFENIARRWNGGPVGHRKKSTETYWGEVKEIMESKWIQRVDIMNI